MIAPHKRMCGVSDYTDHLADKLAKLVDLTRVTPVDYQTGSPADIVHVQHQYFLFGGVAPWKCTFPALARKIKAPAVMTVHEFVDPAGSPMRRAAIRLSNRSHFGHNAIRKYIVHTERDRTRMAAEGFSKDKIAVVRHGVPDPRPLPPTDQAKAAFELEGKFVVTILGFISEKKGHSAAIEAVLKLPDTVHLLMAGGRHPDDKTSYMDRLKVRAASNRIRFTDYLSEDRMAQALAASDLILAPYTESSGSGSLALAFSAGKPIIASDIEPHKELIQESPNAIQLIETGNTFALAQEIARLIEDRKSLTTLAKNSKDYATTHTYTRMAEETVQVYNSILNQSL